MLFSVFSGNKGSELLLNTYLGFQCSIKINNELWFSSFKGNGLFRYDGEHIEHMGNFEEEGAKLFSDIKRHKDKLYFVPLVSTRIYTYDLTSKKIEGIPYKHGTGDFIFSIIYEHFLYMFPSFYHGIARQNLDTLEIEIIDDWINEEFKKYQLSEDAYFRGDYVRKENTIYVPFCNAHAVLEFHLNDGSSVIYNVGNQGNATIASDGKKFWLAPRKSGNILSWDLSTGEVLEYQNFPEGFLNGAFLGSFYKDGYIWLFPESANMVLKIDTKTGEMAEELLFSDICNYKWSAYSLYNAAFVYMKRESEKVLLCSGKSSEVVIFHNNKIERFRLQLPNEISQYYNEEPDSRYLLFRKKRKEKSFFNEYRDYGLSEFIEDIEQDKENGRISL